MHTYFLQQYFTISAKGVEAGPYNFAGHITINLKQTHNLTRPMKNENIFYIQHFQQHSHINMYYLVSKKETCIIYFI
jgi:hypothetical protein